MISRNAFESTGSASDSEQQIELHKPIPFIVDWLIYIGIATCSLLKGLVGVVLVSADAVSYLDLSDAVKNHQWRTLVNGYWFPLYPATLALGRAFFGFRPQYELMAARLVTMATALFFVLSSVALAASVRRLMLHRGVKAIELLPPRVLYVWAAIFSYIFAYLDFSDLTPDALLSSFLILTVAAMIWARVDGSLAAYCVTGLLAGLAFWTKTIAFPWFLLLVFLSAIAGRRGLRSIPRLAVTVLIFGAVAGPYVWQLSAAKGHLSFGDTGALNFAWYDNRADRFNPVEDPAVYHRGTAQVNFKHPGELLSTSPEIAYYGGRNIFGSTPQWDAPGYWWDGMAPRLHFGEIAAALKSNGATVLKLGIMRTQAAILVLVLCLWGFTLRKRSLADLILPAMVVVAIASVAMYLVVYVEARHIAFAFVLIGILFAASAVASRPGREVYTLHLSLLLIAALILIGNFETTLREGNQAQKAGAEPLHGVYDVAVSSAGADLGFRLSPGTEVACMGTKACFLDPYWAKYGGVRMTALVESGTGFVDEEAQAGCRKLQQNPSALDALRQRHVRAIVARFNGDVPCSADWRPLGKSSDFYFLPL